jgi:hypothetical protein
MNDNKVKIFKNNNNNNNKKNKKGVFFIYLLYNAIDTLALFGDVNVSFQEKTNHFFIQCVWYINFKKAR